MTANAKWTSQFQRKPVPTGTAPTFVPKNPSTQRDERGRVLQWEATSTEAVHVPCGFPCGDVSGLGAAAVVWWFWSPKREVLWHGLHGIHTNSDRFGGWKGPTTGARRRARKSRTVADTKGEKQSRLVRFGGLYIKSYKICDC